MAVRTKSVLPEELEGLEYQEYPNLLPRQNEAYGRLLQARPGSYTLLGYGGAMGGGKSIFLSTICNQFALAFPGTRILLCRDTLKALKDSTLIDFMSMLPRQLILKYNHSENWVRIRRETWPKGVYSQVNFMGVHDYEAIGSAAYQIILLDEAHEIPAAAARFLLTRLRWQLPKSVKQAMATQCRSVSQGSDGEWVLCGARCPGATANSTGQSGSQIRFHTISLRPQTPGRWYAEWFAKGEMAEGLKHWGQTATCQSTSCRASWRDNVYLPRNYEARLHWSYPRGAPPLHRWRVRRLHRHGLRNVRPTCPCVEATGDPMYNRVIGGLDFGNESSTGHYTTGVVLLVTPEWAIDDGR
ncbi:MAG: hypothetical protein IPI85_15455 [Dehalococcoidia bacterium]|nr:hypothetical protein [Dehalococcoidia bacterium]